MFLKLVQIRDGFRIRELTEVLKINDGQLSILFGVFELLQKLVNLPQLFKNLDRLGNCHRFTTREWILRREMVDLILIA